MNKTLRLLIWSIFVMTTIEGLAVNIWYPSKVPYLVKDVMILGTYLLLVLLYKDKFLVPGPRARMLLQAFFFFAGLVVAYLVFPGASTLSKLVAVKQRLFYIPMLCVGYLFIRSEKRLAGFFFFMVLSSIAISAYGIYQHFEGPEALTRIGANYSAVVYTDASIEGANVYWRVPGTFTAPGQYGAYLQFIGLIAIGLLMSSGLSRTSKFITALALVFNIFAILVSGSRAPFVLLTVSFALLLIFSGKLRRIPTYALLAYVLLGYGYSFLGPGVKDRFASIASYEHVQRFRSTYFGQLFIPELIERPMGAGLGAATIGARHFSEFGEVELVESYFGIIAVETGFIGLIAILWFCFMILRALFRMRKDISRSSSPPLGYALLAYVLLTLAVLPVSTCIDSSPSNVYFWFSLGALMKFADIQRFKLKTRAIKRQHRAPVRVALA